MNRRAFLGLAVGAGVPRMAMASRARRVIVVGAGLAGLAAAWDLAQSGVDVTVLEARSAPGGRVRTLRTPFADGLHAEAGALLIADTHHLVRHQAEQLGLRLIDVTSDLARELYVVRDRRIVVGGDERPTWPLDLTAEEHALGLPGMWKRYLGAAIDEAGDPTQPGWPSAGLARYDAMSVTELMRTRGASADAAALLALGYLDLGGDGAETCSALAVLRDLALRRGNRRWWVVAGGNDRLPAAMASRLGDRVRYDEEVIRIEPAERTPAVVTRAGGATRRWVADRVVCTLPPPVLRGLDVAPAFSPARRAALAALGATSLTRVLVQTRTRVGRAHAMPSTITDLPVKWVWDATATQPGVRGILDAHLGGAEARRLGRLPAAERVGRVLASLERVYPGVTQQVEASAVVDWDAEPYARGAYAWFKPGQLTTLLRPLAEIEGCVQLAGEHLSSASGWMQGALESGQRAARQLVSEMRAG